MTTPEKTVFCPACSEEHEDPEGTGFCGDCTPEHYCRKCGAVLPDAGDGWDGMCGDCSDEEEGEKE